MFELTFLGTGGSVPSRARNLSGLVLGHHERRFLIDCGEGTQRQLMASGLGLRRLDTVLLTHGHVDHLLGLGGFAATAGLLRPFERLNIHAGPAALRLAEILLTQVIWPAGRPPIALRFAPVTAGPIIETDRLRITAFPVRHAAPDSFGYRFAETRRPALLPERLAALGVPEGPSRARLARGESVVLPGGRRVTPAEVSGPARAAAEVVVVGDTERTADLLAPVRDADLLVIEATFLDRDIETAHAHSHITAGEAARLAAAAGVRRLCLTHITQRYDPAEIAAEARRFFPAVQVMEDFDRVTVAAP